MDLRGTRDEGLALLAVVHDGLLQVLDGVALSGVRTITY
jgi:hypothetical protein